MARYKEREGGSTDRNTERARARETEEGKKTKIFIFEYCLVLTLIGCHIIH